MSPRFFSRWSRLRPLGPSTRGWLAVVGLVGLYEAPKLLRPDGWSTAQLRIPGDLLALLAGFAASVLLPAPLRLALRTVLGLAALALVVYRLDEVVFYFLMREEPLLYDQWFLLRHLFVLLTDLSSAPVIAGLLFGVLAFVGVLAAVRSLLARVERLLHADSRTTTLPLAAMLLALLIVLVAEDHRARSPAPLVAFDTPRIVHNLQQSLAVYRSIEAKIKDSPYRAIEDLPPASTPRPNVHLYLIESYGRLLAEDPELQGPWRAQLHVLEQRLSQAGYHMVSAYSGAPVSGGRSWLAEASLLFGTPVRYEAVFQHLIAERSRVPNLVTTLDRAGYETVLLGPADRARPGVEHENRYAYDRYLGFRDLAYRGPAVGWGLVPDQYSLGFLRDEVLPRVSTPHFVNVHLVTSHAPWKEIPGLAASWRELGDTGEAASEQAAGSNELFVRLRRYARDAAGDFRYLGTLNHERRTRYLRAITYELDVLAEHLLALLTHATTDAPTQGIFFIMGDHQPPVVSSESASFDVPVHVFSRDPNLLAELREQGFTPGLELDAKAVPILDHAGFYSLVARVLARHAVGPDGTPPPFYARGVRLDGH